MEGQKFEIPEDPSRTLPEWSPVGPIFVDLFFETFQFRKRRFIAAILANICLSFFSQADHGLDAA